MFKDKTVLITGGSSGIGKVAAIMFAENGANVAITYKSNEIGAKEVMEELKKYGHKSLAIKADLINEVEAKKVIEKTVEEFKGIDILVNNAGRYIDGDEWDASFDTWVQSLLQNLVSAMNISKYASKIFLKKQNGIIVNIASRFSTNGQPDAISYGAAKAGVVNITQSYAKLLAPFGRANVISPSAVKVGYWLKAPKEELEAQGKLIEPEDVAKKILFLASDEARDINGQNFPITA